MTWDDLTEDDRAELLRLLRQAIDGDRYPLSPRVRRWKGMLTKLDPPTPAAPIPYPVPKPPGEPSLLYRKLRGGRQRR